jgi:hypothetical protein
MFIKINSSALLDEEIASFLESHGLMLSSQEVIKNVIITVAVILERKDLLTLPFPNTIQKESSLRKEMMIPTYKILVPEELLTIKEIIDWLMTPPNALLQVLNPHEDDLQWELLEKYFLIKLVFFYYNHIWKNLNDTAIKEEVENRILNYQVQKNNRNKNEKTNFYQLGSGGKIINLKVGNPIRVDYNNIVYHWYINEWGFQFWSFSKKWETKKVNLEETVVWELPSNVLMKVIKLHLWRRINLNGWNYIQYYDDSTWKFISLNFLRHK